MFENAFESVARLQMLWALSLEGSQLAPPKTNATFYCAFPSELKQEHLHVFFGPAKENSRVSFVFILQITIHTSTIFEGRREKNQPKK